MEKTKIDWCDSTWKPIPDHENYFASKDGRILSTKKKDPAIMKPILSKDGHMYVFLYDKGKMKKMWIHRAVLLAWDREPMKNEEARHLNDIPSDNRLENLCWGSRLENVSDKRRNGGIRYGEKSVFHKLTDVQVMEIREKYSKDKSLTDLSAEYRVSKSTILQIVRGNKWKHLPIIRNTVKHSTARKTPLPAEHIRMGTEALNRYAQSIRKERRMIYCACGCGNMLETPDSKGRYRKFVHGHNNRKAVNQ